MKKKESIIRKEEDKESSLMKEIMPNQETQMTGKYSENKRLQYLLKKS